MREEHLRPDGTSPVPRIPRCAISMYRCSSEWMSPCAASATALARWLDCADSAFLTSPQRQQGKPLQRLLFLCRPRRQVLYREGGVFPELLGPHRRQCADLVGVLFGAVFRFRTI